MKRIFDLDYSDYFTMGRHAILETIRSSEGRTLLCETIISVSPLLDGISNPETAAAFSADLITLNTFDFTEPFIYGYDDLHLHPHGGRQQYFDALKKQVRSNAVNEAYIRRFKAMVGRFLGANMEPVPEDHPYPDGLRLSRENLLAFKKFEFDYLVITANPNTAIGDAQILQGILLARSILGEETLIFAGKMHGAGTASIYEKDSIARYVEAGADVILVPAPGTVPGFTLEVVKGYIEDIHAAGALAMTTIGTSQEGAREGFMEITARDSKMAGADIQHTGDAGFGGMTPPENILALSIAMRGRRHTYRRMARSSRR